MTPPPQAVPPDSVRAVLRRVFAAPEFEWTQHRSVWSWLRHGLEQVLAFLERMQLEHPIGYLAVMLVLVLICVLMFVHMGSILRRALRPAHRDAPGTALLADPPDAAWHLKETGRLVRAGRFREALGHRFLALVLELGRRRAVTIQPSKTPAEYAQEVALDAQGRRDFSDLVTRLYAALFGGAPCDAEAWTTFDRAAGALMQRVQAR